MSTSDNRRRAFESLIEQGLAVPVPGKTRPGRDGKPEAARLIVEIERWLAARAGGG